MQQKRLVIALVGFTVTIIATYVFYITTVCIWLNVEYQTDCAIDPGDVFLLFSTLTGLVGAVVAWYGMKK